MSEDFTLYRGERGTPHLVDARCPHRGTRLSSGWIEGDALRCFYHGWKFDGAGACVEQPAEEDAFCHKVSLASYPLREYLGLVFAFLGTARRPSSRCIPSSSISTAWSRSIPTAAIATTSRTSRTRST